MGGGRQTGIIVERPQGWLSEAARILGRPYEVDVVGLVLGGRKHNYEDLDDVMQLPRLRRLILSNAKITPKVIAGLAQFTWLEELTFRKTSITQQEIEELKKRLPSTSIVTR
jgi:hypothetical protein